MHLVQNAHANSSLHQHTKHHTCAHSSMRASSQIPALSHTSGVSALVISGGGATSCAIVTGGRLLCWGNNMDGQLGIGSSGDARNSPAEVAGVAMGNKERCAVYIYMQVHADTSGWGGGLKSAFLDSYLTVLHSF